MAGLGVGMVFFGRFPCVSWFHGCLCLVRGSMKRCDAKRYSRSCVGWSVVNYLPNVSFALEDFPLLFLLLPFAFPYSLICREVGFNTSVTWLL
ncbi:hypothetical protein BKA81DRAFT_366874 [Phyllosticta paracitricarpa]